MKNKLINIKNLLRIVISVMVIFSMFKSCKAYAAAVTTSMLSTINERANTVFEHFGYTYRNKFNSTSGIGYNTSINKMCIGITASDSPYYPNYLFVFYPDNNPMGVLNTTPKKYNTWFYGVVNLNNGNYSSISGGTIPITTKWDYVYTEFAWQSATGYSFSANEEYGAYIFTEPPNPFYFGHMFSQPYNYNNTTIEACELNYNYRVQFIDNIVTEDYEVISINATLDEIPLECTNLGDYWTLKCTNSTLLTYNKIYTLNAEITRSDTTNDLSEQILFVPPGTLIESGVIVRYPSGDYSFNTENATNQIIENQDNSTEKQTQEIIDSLTNSNEVENIMDETLSGDIETISGQLGFSPLENPFTSFLFFVVDGVYDVLTERENITLTAPYKSLNFTISSQDFITPNSELKTFIRNMLICVYIYGNYKYFHYMITLLETARINKFMAEIGTDEFYDTDIM